LDMQLSNKKLVDRAIRMLMDELQVDENEASRLLKQHRNVRNVFKHFKKK